MRRLVTSLALAAVAAAISTALGRPDFSHSALYTEFSTWLLAMGLLGSTATISLELLAGRFGALLAAVSLGVVAKAVVIGSGMALVFRTPQSALLGIAVAQIDPLSVSALNRRGSLTARGKTFLAAWASFDDPVTVLLTLSLSAAVLSWTGAQGVGLPGGLAEGGLRGFVASVLMNLLFTAVLWIIWRTVHAVGRRARRSAGGAPTDTATPTNTGTRGPRPLTEWIELALLVMALAASVRLSLLFGLALSGLFLRPRILCRAKGEVFRERLLDLAYYLAVVMLGFALSHGVDLLGGVVLGGFAFLAQALVAPLLARRAESSDRIRLALAQQNGITAILLGLTLEPAFPGVLRTIAPAILVINVLHLGSTRLLDRRWPVIPAPARDHTPQEPDPAPEEALISPEVDRPTASNADSARDVHEAMVADTLVYLLAGAGRVTPDDAAGWARARTVSGRGE